MELFIGGGIILFYLGIVMLVVILVLSWAGKKRFGALGKSVGVLAVLFSAYAIPFGDDAIGVIKFKKLCDEQAGPKVQKTIDGVEGILWGRGKRSKPYTTFGYTFYETQDAAGGVFRYVRSSNGSVYEEKDEKSRARFFIYQSAWLPISNHFSKLEFSIKERDRNELIASYSLIHYEGGWLKRSLRGIGLNGPTCPEGQIDYIGFIHAVLKGNGRAE